MSEVYIYQPDCDDFSTIGVCGRLDASLCDCEMVANGMIELTLEHPLDPMGRYLLLQEGWILKTEIPVLSTPELVDGEYVTTVETWRISPGATKAQRTVWSKQTNGKKKKVLKANTKVTVTSAPATGSRYKIKSGKVTGWIESDGLINKVTETIQASASGIEKVVPSWELKEQTFRIYNVTQADNVITVNAEARSNDLAKNLTTYDTNGAVSLQAALNGILNNTLDSHEAEAWTDIRGTQVGAHYRDRNPIEAILDPEDGLCARFNAQLVRDEMDFYLLSRAGMDRGLRIEYARDLSGIHMSTNIDDVVTHVRPIGETKAGGPLYLTTAKGLVACPNASKYPFMRIYPYKVSGAKVDKEVSVALARTRMAQAANDLIDTGIDEPKVDAKISYDRLGDTPRYAQYKKLRNKAFLYDTITIYNPVLNIDMKAQVSRLKWDCLRERTKDMNIGSLSKLAPSISSWQISGSINGGKLTAGTVGGAALIDGAIDVRHIQADSINTDALQANAVTAAKMATDSFTAQTAIVQKLSSEAIAALTATINAITAGDISTNTLSAAFAHLMQVVADNIQAGTVTADALDAVMASIVSISVGAASFNKAEIQHLRASALVLDEGQAGSMHITNLAVTSANLLNATVGKLVIKGDDGNYYEVGVGSDGVIRTAQYDATAQEIADGRTTDGRQIVTETINAEAITGETVKAQEAVLNRVLTAALTAGQITANDAMLASASIPLLYTTSIRALGNSLDISANQSIQLLVGNVNAIGEDIRRMIRIEQDGLHVGDSQTTNEVLIDSESVNVVLGGLKYSKFAADYVQFGDYQLRRSVDGGLVFKKA